MFNLFRTLVLLAISFYYFIAYAGEISDPTKPTGYRGATVGTAKIYRLESILLGRDRKIAIINGQSYSEGDKHKLGKIINIKSDSVVVQGSKQHILKLVTPSIKKTVDKK